LTRKPGTAACLKELYEGQFPVEGSPAVVKATTSPILDLIRRAVEDPHLRELPDHQLVERFHAQQDETAFHTLLRRHGPLVLDVCRGVLGHEADAEDAFQATFFVLARKACSIRKKASLASWLHGVAYRTARKARAQFAARQKHEARVPARPPCEPDDLSWREVRQLLHEEVSGLPERYRAPLVLCYLEGATQEAAAIQLHLAKSTLRERLERGRTLLRTRLLRRGVGAAALLVAAAWPAASASACVSPSLMAATAQAASLFAAGPAAAGAVSAKVAALTEGVLKAMQLTKLKIAATVALVVGALGVGASALPYRTAAAEPPPPGSKSAVPVQDQGNLKETVLALEKRIWEGHAKQDVDTFKSLLADDFVGMDMFGRPYDKAATLDYVAKFRVIEHELKDVKVIPLNPTSAVLSYEVHYKVRPTDGQEIESTTRRATAAWAQRKGRWYYVYFEDRIVPKDGAAVNVIGFDWKEDLREILLKTHREKVPPKD
jgi:RNA polymerase sigma factor (sigma-70 family)